MSITILGEHITIIRQGRIPRPIIRRGDRPKAKQNQKPLTVKEHTGRVTAVVVAAKGVAPNSKTIITMPVPATHADIIELYRIPPEGIIKLGYQIGQNIVWN